MRGALACLIAAGLALCGATLVFGSETTKIVTSTAAAASDGSDQFGTAKSKTGDPGESQRGPVDETTVKVGKGIVETHAATDGTGRAEAHANDVNILNGVVIIGGARRVATRTVDGLRRTGKVYALRVDGKFYGDVDGPKSIPLAGGGRVVLNQGDAAVRVKTDIYDIRVAIASVTVTKATPTPTPTPTPTATPTEAPTQAPTQAATAQPTKTPKVKHAPTVKQRLTRGGYAFPIYGKARVADNFGAARAAPIVSHEGDDIFADFGSPVVAVRDGKIDHVGTLPISGNRLWLHTANGDSFFYAHLSAFSDAAKDGAHVKAGTVLGFVGNTGDAEPTPPHLHFEVHPGGMNEDAVDPYPIVTAWQKRDDVPPGAWLQQLGQDAADRPGELVTVRDFIAE